MICLLSPAKTMIASHKLPAVCHSLPERSLPLFQQQANTLGKVLKSKLKSELKNLCGVSDALSTHVKEIYNELLVDKDDDAIKVGVSRYNQAALMFDGPAFRGLAASDLTPEEGQGLQKHLRILTGLYGYVKPGDLIQEHRLCMGTKLVVSDEQKDLYTFWGNQLAIEITSDLRNQLKNLKRDKKSTKKGDQMSSPVPLIVNCASQEYSKSVLPHLNTGDDGGDIRIVECVFLDDGIIKSAFAKRARGLMSRFVCTHQILHGSDSEVDKIKLFDLEGYRFSQAQSSDDRLVFVRAPRDVPPPPSAKSASATKTGVKSSTVKMDSKMKKVPTTVTGKRISADEPKDAEGAKLKRTRTTTDTKSTITTTSGRITRSRTTPK